MNQGWIVGRNGSIFKTTNSGLDWVYQANPITGTGKYLKSVHFQDSNTGWIAGFSGVIFKTTNGGITFIEEETNPIQPLSFLLFQNYPNPFNPVTKIKFEIPGQARNDNALVTLKVYDILGRKVATLVNEEKPAGEYEVEFNTANLTSRQGSALTSGIYFYQLKVGDPSTRSGQAYTETKKMILIK